MAHTGQYRMFANVRLMDGWMYVTICLHMPVYMHTDTYISICMYVHKYSGMAGLTWNSKQGILEEVNA